MGTEFDDVCGIEDFSNAYRNWLVYQMEAQDYGILFDFLYETEFRWDPRIPRDEDRADDGRYLRLRFSNDSGMPIFDEWLGWPCSFLEFLVALAYSIDDAIMYDPGRPHGPAKWFWTMMENSGLSAFTDAVMMHEGMGAYWAVTEAVETVMERTYSYDGSAGLFPLQNPAMDQRQVEIWYQANAYFIEEYFE